MLTAVDLRKMSKERLEEAELLFAADKYDTAFYICGYAVEFRLKARIVTTLKWPGFPDSRADVPVELKAFHTHTLVDLLHLSGRWQLTTAGGPLFTDWSVVSTWDASKCRYRACGSVPRQKAAEMIQSTKIVVKAL